MSTCSSSSFLFLSSLLILVSSTIPAINAACVREVVLDTDGQIVRPGTEYYVVPIVRFINGGLTLGPNINNSCPFDVLQSPSEGSNGLPVVFTSVDSADAIRVSTDLNIKFNAVTMCVQSTVWQLAPDESIGQTFITTGGQEGNPGRDTLSNWFKIEKASEDDDNGGYKLSFCPILCTTCGKILCRDIGVYVDDNGVRRLALSLDNPLIVKFLKV